MKQDDSLNGALQNLASLQQQQIMLLNQMNNNQSQQLMLEQQKNTREISQTPVSLGAPTSYGGAQGYMPQAQSFAPPMILNGAHNQYENFKQQVGQMTPSSGHYGFFDTVLSNSKTSQEARTAMSIDYADRASSALTSGIGTIASAGAGIGITAAIPGALGMALGAGTGLGIGALVTNGVNEMKKQSAYEKYFARESYKYITPDKSNNTRGLGGFSIKEGQDASTFLRNLSTDNYMKDSEMMQITQRFTEGGLLKDTKDLDNFKEKMETLTKNVKTGALILNETYDSIANLMAEMKKAGIDNKNFNNLMGTGKMLGALTGTDGGDITRQLMNFAKQLNAGTGVGNEGTISRTSDTMIYMQDWYNNLLNNPSKTSKEQEYQNLIVNSGGVSGASMAVQNAMEQLITNKTFHRAGFNFFDYVPERQEFQFNRGKFDDFLGGNKTYEELMNDFSAKATALQDAGHVEAVKEWENNAGTYIKNSLNHGQLSKMLNKTVGAYKNSIEGADLSFEQVLGQMGVNDSSSRNLLSGYLQHRDEKGDGFGNYMRLQALWETSNSAHRAQTPSLGERFSAATSRVGKTLAAPFVDFGDMFKRGFVNFTDKLYGIEKEVGLPPSEQILKFESSLKDFSAVEVSGKINEINKALSTGTSAFKKMQDKGYNVDKQLLSFMDAMDDDKGKVKYTRDKITNWDDVIDSIKSKKNVITDQASKNDLSESILAALTRYNQQKGVNTTDSKIADIAQKVGQLTFDYGGNKDLALAAYQLGDGGKGKIDELLGKMGYYMDDLREGGQQNAVQSMDLAKIGLDEKTIAMVGEIMDQALTKGGSTATTVNTPPTTETKPASTGQDFGGATENTKANRNAIIASADANGISRLALASLMSTEQEGNNPNSYKANSVETGIFGITQLGVDTVNGLIRNGLRSKTTGESVSSVEQVKGNAALQIDITSQMFKERLDKSQGNAALAYAFYNGNMTKVARDLANIGFTSDMYGKATDEETLEAIGRARGTGHESYRATQRYIKMKGKESVELQPIETVTEGGTTTVTTLTPAPDLQTTTVGVAKDKNRSGIEGDNPLQMKDLSRDPYFKNYQNVRALYENAMLTDEQGKKREDELLNKAYDKLGFFNRAYASDQLLKSQTNEKSGFSKYIFGKDEAYYKANYDTLMKDKAPAEYAEYLAYKDMRAKNGVGMTAGSQKDILVELGKQLGVEAQNFTNLGTYNSALVNSARAFYNENYKSASDYNAGNLSPAGHRWDNMDVSEKAMMLKMMQMIEKLDVVKPGLEGSISGEVKDTMNLFGEKDRELMKHLSKERDAKGKETGRVVFNPAEVSKDKIGADEVLKYQEGGAKNIDSTGSAKAFIEKTTGTKIGDASISGLKGMIQAQMEKIATDSLKDIGDFSKEALKLSKDKMNGLSAKQAEELATIMNDPSGDNSKNQLNAMKRDLQGQIQQGKSNGTDTAKLEASEKSIDKLIQLADKIGSTDTKGIMEVLKNLEELGKIAADVGKMGKLFSSSLMDKDSKKEFDASIKGMIDDSLTKAGIKTSEDVLAMLQGKGEFKGIQIDAKSVENLANKVKEGTEAGIRKSLDTKEGREKIKNYADSQDGLGGVSDKLAGLETWQKKLDELSKDSNRNADEYSAAQKNIEDLKKSIVDELAKSTAETIDKNKDLSDQVSTLGKSSEDLGTLMGQYDKSIQSAISTLRKRVDEGWNNGPQIGDGGLLGMVRNFISP